MSQHQIFLELHGTDMRPVRSLTLSSWVESLERKRYPLLFFFILGLEAHYKGHVIIRTPLL